MPKHSAVPGTLLIECPCDDSIAPSKREARRLFEQGAGGRERRDGDQDPRPVRARPLQVASAAGSASSNGTVRFRRASRAASPPGITSSGESP